MPSETDSDLMVRLKLPKLSDWRFSMHKTAVVLIMVASTLWAGVQSAIAQDGDRHLSPYFLIEGGGEGQERFPLKSTTVKAVISGVIADVKVTQTYANLGTAPINARYVFPAATGAAVHGMRMTVGEEVIEARIKARPEARQVFKEAKTAGKKCLAFGAAATQCVFHGCGQYHARRNHRHRSALQRTAGARGGHVPVRLPHGGRTALFHHPRKRRRRSSPMASEPLPDRRPASHQHLRHPGHPRRRPAHPAGGLFHPTPPMWPGTGHPRRRLPWRPTTPTAATGISSWTTVSAATRSNPD